MFWNRLRTHRPTHHGAVVLIFPNELHNSHVPHLPIYLYIYIRIRLNWTRLNDMGKERNKPKSICFRFDLKWNEMECKEEEEEKNNVNLTAQNDWLQSVSSLSLDDDDGCRWWRKCDRIVFSLLLLLQWISSCATDVNVWTYVYVRVPFASNNLRKCECNTQMRWMKRIKKNIIIIINSRYIKHSVIHFVKYDHDLMSECLSFVSHSHIFIGYIYI